MEKRKNRSDKYQYLLLEISSSHEMLETFRNEDSISHRLNPFQYDEDIIDLEDQLKEEFWRVVDATLTDRQKQVIKFSADGYTQMETAKLLGVNQSSITKSLHGNVDYRKNKKVYGGIEKKLKKIVDSDPKIKEILDKIAELRQEKW